MNLSFLIHNNSLSTIPPPPHIRSATDKRGPWCVTLRVQLKLESAELIQNITRGNCCDGAVLQEAVLCLIAVSHA